MSEIRANTISDAAGTGPVTLTKQSAAKAWVNFNGTGTIAARDSFNVSSLTDRGTGRYTVSFANSFGAADYSATAVAAKGDSTQDPNFSTLIGTTLIVPTSSSIPVITGQPLGPVAQDSAFVNVTIHGDLA